MSVFLPPFVGGESSPGRFKTKEKLIKFVGLRNSNRSTNQIGVVALGIIDDVSEKKGKQKLKERLSFFPSDKEQKSE